MGKTSISWTERAWNPVIGCSVVSPGCTNCYAMRMAARIQRMNQGSHYEGTTKPSKAGAVWTGKVALAPERTLTEPLRRRKPTTYFVNSMGDLFHEDVPDAWIDRVFAVMALAPQHTFQVLTKRSARMRAYLSAARTHPVGMAALDQTFRSMATDPGLDVGKGVMLQGDICHLKVWPLPNVWLGVSAEDQVRYDERAEDLKATPAAVHFFSFEPLLGPIATGYLGEWAIIGGESGPKARPCWTPNVRSIVRQCAKAGAAAYVKQLGANVRDRNDAGFEGCDPSEWPDIDPADVEHDLDGMRDGYQGAPVRIHLRSRKGDDPSEWPEDLRVREMPTTRSADADAPETGR